MHSLDLLVIIVAGAVGALLVTVLLEASPVLALPAALLVGVVSLVTDRGRRTSR